MLRIIVVRHGQTKWNIGQVSRGRADVPLNQTGKLQAKSLAKALSGFKISAIYTSPLSRAKETAQAIAQKQNLKIKISDLLLDISYGKWQGLSHHQVAKKWPRLYQLWHETPHKVKFPGGESLADVRKKVKKFLKEVISQHLKTPTLKDNFLIIGDSNVDCEFSHNSQITMLGVSWDVGSPTALKEAGAKYIINNICDLLRFI